MAPTCVGLMMEILARDSNTSANHDESTDSVALGLPSAASVNPVLNPLSYAGPHHTQPFLLAYMYQYHGPLTEAESALFTIGDKMPTYPGVISHAAAVYAPESLTQQHLEEYLARNFSGNWFITQDPAAIVTYDADITEAAVAFAQAEADAEIRRRNVTLLNAVAAYVEGLEKVPMDSLGEDSRDCSICKGMRSLYHRHRVPHAKAFCSIFIGSYREPVSMNKCLPEHPVRMPCGHVFGVECITLLLR